MHDERYKQSTHPTRSPCPLSRSFCFSLFYALSFLLGSHEQISLNYTPFTPRYFDRLRVQKEDMLNDAISVREALRAELHTYGALAEEGDAAGLAQELETKSFSASDELEDFFRKAGGLKPEMKTTIALLNNPRLIYDEEVNDLQGRAQFILSCSGLDEILEGQGKQGERKAIQAILEKLRTSPRADLPPLVPILLKQLNKFQTITGFPMDVVNELKDLCARLEAIVSYLRMIVSCIFFSFSLSLCSLSHIFSYP